MSDDMTRLVKNLAVIAVISVAGVFTFRYLFTEDQNKLIIEDTHIHIESIRTIAEISAISYTDEVVIDTVEYYEGETNVFDPRDWIRWYNDNVERRLTVVIKGEVKYGVRLTEGGYKIDSSPNKVILTLPKPIILDVIISPSKTEIFHEKGNWDDGVLRKMQMKAKAKLIENAKELELDQKAMENTRDMFKKLIITDKQLIIEFDESN